MRGAAFLAVHTGFSLSEIEELSCAELVEWVDAVRRQLEPAR